jgi:hypothetical protein
MRPSGEVGCFQMDNLSTPPGDFGNGYNWQVAHSPWLKPQTVWYAGGGRPSPRDSHFFSCGFMRRSDTRPQVVTTKLGLFRFQAAPSQSAASIHHRSISAGWAGGGYRHGVRRACGPGAAKCSPRRKTSKNAMKLHPSQSWCKIRREPRGQRDGRHLLCPNLAHRRLLTRRSTERREGPVDLYLPRFALSRIAVGDRARPLA